ncbi:MAG: hypothetical protein GC160_10570 [Acidobacteria bacterium]|nr:hypothetical protein [Acidobacteriota bacterium]
MMTTRRFLRSAAPAIAVVLMAGVFAVSPSTAADKDKKEKPTRTVKGIVTDDSDNPITAVVQLKNLRTLDVRSYNTDKQGRYYFSGLDLNTDYEIRAFADGWGEKVRRVSAFDDRMELFYQLKLKKE